MDQARWERVQNLFHQASALNEPERASFLESACGHDADLLREVQAMLTADADTPSILDRSINEIASHILGSPGRSVPEQDFGPYRLKRILGEGGMGVVWLAERLDAGNLVAIKFLPHAGLSPSRRERFAREIRLLAKLRHPYIARLYDAGALPEGTPWFVMEYVEGERFSDYSRRPGRSVQERLHLFRRVCEAVQYAHSQEIIHRDLKPSNIMVARDGTPRLLDFGIARELQQFDESGDLTKAGLRFFSADYSAPEWAQDGVVGFGIDVYSLGVILYETLTGQLPFAGSRRATEHEGSGLDLPTAEKPSLVVRRSYREAPDGDEKLSTAAWGELDVLCLKATHRDPRERYQSVEALIRDVDHYLRHEPLEARPDTVLYRASRFVRRNRAAVLATCAAVVVLVGMVVFFTLRLTRARNAAVAEAAREKRIQDFMLNLFEGGDPEAGPANDIRVTELLDRGAQQAGDLSNEPEVQADLNQTLGTMYEKLGKLDRADTLLQLSLKEREALAERDPPAVADNLIAMGLLRSDQGQGKEAERLVHQAIELIRKTEPRNKLHMAKAESALGTAMAADGQQAEAVNVLKHAIAIQSLPDASSVDLARSVNSLADAQIYLGDYVDANFHYSKALALDRQIYGGNHPLVGDNLSDLGQIQEIWGHYGEADKLERQALAIATSWYGSDHPDTARKMTALARTLEYENHVAEAEALLRHALVITESVYGPMHPHVAYVLNSLGAVAIDHDDFKNAEEYFARMENIYRVAFGKDDYRVAIAMANLASGYGKEKRYKEAEQLFRQAIAIETRVLPPNDINTAIGEIKLGRLLLFEKRYREGARYTLAGYQSLLKQTSPSTSFVRGARHDLVIDYDALKEPEEAQKYRDDAAQAH